MREATRSLEDPLSREGAGPVRWWILAAGVLALLIAAPAHTARAYSYSAQGAEPLIDAREEVRDALNASDLSRAQEASQKVQEELTYLDEEFSLSLRSALESAFQAGDAQAVDRVFRAAFVAEIRRRLSAAGGLLSDYQSAKTLVVKAKRFFDLLAPDLDTERRDRGNTGLVTCLEAIGNPGVFGVGARDPDPEAFERGRAEVFASLETP